MKALLSVGLAATAALVAGCSSASSSSSSTLPVYSSNQIGTVSTVETGTVVSVTDVYLQAPSRSSTATGTGATLGAAVLTGAITGSSNAVAGAVGNIAGGAIGAKADDRVGVAIVVQMSDGSQKQIVQEKTTDVFYPGQRVKLQTGSAGRGSSRVTPAEDLSGDPNVIGRKL